MNLWRKVKFLFFLSPGKRIREMTSNSSVACLSRSILEWKCHLFLLKKNSSQRFVLLCLIKQKKTLYDYVFRLLNDQYQFFIFNSVTNCPNNQMCPDAEPLLGDTQGECCNLHLVRYNIICLYYANAILWGMDNPCLLLCPTGNGAKRRIIFFQL